MTDCRVQINQIEYQILQFVEQDQCHFEFTGKRVGTLDDVTIRISMIDKEQYEEHLNIKKILCNSNNELIMINNTDYLHENQSIKLINKLGELQIVHINIQQELKPKIILEVLEKNESHLDVTKQLSETEVFNIIYQCCIALSFLHSKKIIHRDIKPFSIIRCNDNKIKISNLHFAKKQEYKMESVGTIEYMAPEILKITQNKGHYDEKADSWSIGVLAYLLVIGTLPFKSRNLQRFITQQQQSITLDIVKDLKLRDLIFSLLVYDVKNRPTVTQYLIDLQPSIKCTSTLLLSQSNDLGGDILLKSRSNEKSINQSHEPCLFSKNKKFTEVQQQKLLCAQVVDPQPIVIEEKLNKEDTK